MEKSSEGQVALLVDFEKLATAEDIDCEVLSTFAEEYGRVLIANAYADWSDLSYQAYQSDLHSFGIDLVQVMAGYQDKNTITVDIKLAEDAIDLTRTMPHINIFVIVSSDLALIHLNEVLLNQGRTIIGMSPQGYYQRQKIAKQLKEFIQSARKGLNLPRVIKKISYSKSDTLADKLLPKVNKELGNFFQNTYKRRKTLQVIFAAINKSKLFDFKSVYAHIAQDIPNRDVVYSHLMGAYHGGCFGWTASQKELPAKERQLYLQEQINTEYAFIRAYEQNVAFTVCNFVDDEQEFSVSLLAGILGFSEDNGGLISNYCKNLFPQEIVRQLDRYDANVTKIKKASDADLAPVKQAIQLIIAAHPDGILGGKLKTLLRQELSPTFDESAYGFKQFEQLLHALKDIVVLKDDPRFPDILVCPASDVSEHSSIPILGASVTKASDADLAPVKQAIQLIIAAHPDGILGGKLKTLLRQELSPTFDESAYGFKQFKQLLHALKDIVVLKDDPRFPDILVCPASYVSEHSSIPILGASVTKASDADLAPVKQAIQLIIAAHPDGILGGKLKTLLRQELSPTFDESAYGFKQFKQLLHALKDIVVLKDDPRSLDILVCPASDVSEHSSIPILGASVTVGSTSAALIQKLISQIGQFEKNADKRHKFLKVIFALIKQQQPFCLKEISDRVTKMEAEKISIHTVHNYLIKTIYKKGFSWKKNQDTVSLQDRMMFLRKEIDSEYAFIRIYEQQIAFSLRKLLSNEQQLSASLLAEVLGFPPEDEIKQAYCQSLLDDLVPADTAAADGVAPEAATSTTTLPDDSPAEVLPATAATTEQPESIVGKKEASDADLTPVKKAFQEIITEYPHGVSEGALKILLSQKLSTSFDAKNYGFEGFTQLLNALEDVEIKGIRDGGGPLVYSADSTGKSTDISIVTMTQKITK